MYEQTNNLLAQHAMQQASISPAYTPCSINAIITTNTLDEDLDPLAPALSAPKLGKQIPHFNHAAPADTLSIESIMDG